MTSPLLATKLYVPPVRPDWVPRPQLLARLDQGLNCRLTLVSGPAGFGKTTLLSKWVQTRSPSPGSEAGSDEGAVGVAWLSLDQADNDLVRFWLYVVAALQTAHEGLGATILAALQSPQPPAMELLLTALINELIALGSRPLVLVIDDSHIITAAAVHESLLFLVEHLPPAVHLFLAGRADPPWPLARLRVTGDMVEVRTEDLRFTPAEVEAFLNEVMRLGLSAADVATLDERTEGWIVGLQMAALSMQGRKDAPAFIQSFRGSHRFILDYLVEEVLERQPPDVQSFLHQTALLDRLTAPLCDAVTGRQGSQGVLAQLERANLFLVPLDDQRCWYRYHHLFADLLRSRLERSHPDQVAVLHGRASEWYEQQQLLVEALTHALAAHDVDRVAYLAEENVLGMMEHGNLGLLVEWLDALPDELVRSRPWLCIARAWALAHTGAFEAAEPCLEDAAQALEGGQERGLSAGTSPEDADHIRGHLSAIRCYMLTLQYGYHPAAIELAQSALAQLPETDWRARGLAAVLLGLGHRVNMAYAEAHAALAKALAIGRAAQQEYVVVDVLCQIARVERDQGRLRQAAATCREALRMAQEYGGPGCSRLPVASYALITLSEISYEWNDLEAAFDQGQCALTLARQWGQMDALSGGYYSLVTACTARQEFDRALAYIHEMKRLSASFGRYPRWPVVLEALLRLTMDDLPGATQCVTELLPHSDEEWRLGFLIPVYVAQFRQGLRASLDDVLAYVTRFLQAAETAGSQAGMVQGLAWQALAHQALGQSDEARTALTRAVAIAEPEGYVRIFVDNGAAMRELLTAVLAAQRARPGEADPRIIGYAGRLLSVLAAEAPGEASSLLSSSALAEPLSTREMEVLRFLATPLPTPEIARELVVSTNTVRSHIKSIYGKLNAHGRIEAVQRARELGLLE